MARAETVTWLSLDRWGQILQINPLHLNGVASAAVSGEVCRDYWTQFAYQDAHKVSREDVAQAIHDAERMLANFTGYSLLPDWIVDERRQAARPPAPELYSTGWNVRGQHKSVAALQGYVWAGGQKAQTLISAGAAVTYSDEDGDGYKETATVTVATAVTPCEVHAYFPAAAIAPYGANAGADEWEVRPIRAVQSGANVVITFRREQLPDPDLWMRLNAEAIDGDVDANFLTTVDVYRVWNDPQAQAQFLWEAPTCALCEGAGCAACQIAVQAGCLTVRDQRLGFITYQPAEWDAATGQFDPACWADLREPDRMRLWYYAGWRDESRPCPAVQMDPYWERAVAYLAVALLDRDLCGCNNVAHLARHWREDLARSGRDVAFQTTPAQLDNPFGTTRGAIYAWNRANQEGRTLGR